MFSNLRAWALSSPKLLVRFATHSKISFEKTVFSFSVALHKGIFLPFDTVGKVSTPHGSDLCSPIFP